MIRAKAADQGRVLRRVPVFLALLVIGLWSGNLHAQGASEWVAYNDLLSAGPGDGNAPNVTRHHYQTAGGVLVDFATGAALPLTVTGSVVGGLDPTGNGGSFGGGTDGGHTFGGVADLAGSYELDGADWRNVVTFEGLDPTKTYTIAVTANRNSGSYANARFTQVTLEGADAFVNASTPGVVVHSEASVSFSTGYNTMTGYVARWTDVVAADGSVSVVSAWNPALGSGGRNTKGYAMSVFRIEQFGAAGPACTGDGDCDDGNVCTDHHCNLVTGQCAYPPNMAPCDDGVACTANDHCSAGECAGADGCPPGESCNLESGACQAGPVGAPFSAYNDLAWLPGQPNQHITLFTSPVGGSGLPSAGEMVDFDSGDGTGVILAVTGGQYNGGGHGDDGRDAPMGTDAFDLFGGVVSTQGAVAYINAPNSPLVLTFSGLDPVARYTLALHGDRGAYGWDRASQVALAGADAFVNESSHAVDNPSPGSGGALFEGPGDDSTRVPADNPHGYVARFIHVEPGMDGELALVIDADGTQGFRGKYANAVMLQQEGVEPPETCEADAECNDANPCTDDTCDLETGNCVLTANNAGCDDGVACTVDDQCANGTCGAGAPNHDACDNGNVCTDGLCNPATGCEQHPNQAVCDDGVGCTANDVCADGACGGHDSCPEGESCDTESDACVAVPERDTTFTAFNDLAWRSGQDQNNITRFTSPEGGSGLPSHGELIDFETAEVTGVMLTVLGGRYDGGGHGMDGGNAAPGTDAHAVFEGAVSTRGAIAYTAGPLVLHFTGLDPDTRYEVVFHGDRGAYDWSRAALVTIDGVDAFQNESSTANDNPAPGSDGTLFSGPDDPATRLPSSNPNGYVARFTEIDPGADGEMRLVIEANGNAGYRGKYASAVMLQAGASAPTACVDDADCDDGNACTDDHCTVETGVCATTPNAAPCDDGVECTQGDQCANGACAAGQPDHAACDDSDACTDDVCHPADGCQHPHNAAPCDDDVPCTGNDTCANGVCAGADTCPQGEICEPVSGLCEVYVPPGISFVAYNDLAWRMGQESTRITHYTTLDGGSGLPPAGALVDHDTGEQLDVTLAVTGGLYNGRDHGTQGRNSSPGTDAHGVFGGIVSTLGAISYLSGDASPVELTFGGLDPAGVYEIVLHGDRAGYDWARASRITIASADAFRNESSVAHDNPAPGSGGALFSGVHDDSTRLPSDNVHGYVARFTHVRPGEDGEVRLLVAADADPGGRGKYVSAVMIAGADFDPNEPDAGASPPDASAPPVPDAGVPDASGPDAGLSAVNDAIDRSVAWFASTQNGNGTWPDTVDGSWGTGSSQIATGRILAGLVSAGVPVDDPMIQAGYGYLAGIATNGMDPYAMWGLLAVGVTPDLRDRYIASSAALQQGDGSWPGWGYGSVFQTGMRLITLLRLDVPADDPMVQDGLAFLFGTQRADGHWSGLGPYETTAALVTMQLINDPAHAHARSQAVTWLKQGSRWMGDHWDTGASAPHELPCVNAFASISLMNEEGIHSGHPTAVTDWLMGIQLPSGAFRLPAPWSATEAPSPRMSGLALMGLAAYRGGLTVVSSGWTP